MEQTMLESLPITIIADDLQVDDQFLAITKTTSFLTRHLRKYYLSISSVYQKIVYKTFWIEEKFSGPLTKQKMKLKATLLFPDVVGIEFAKTKTIYSKDHPRLLEVLQGKGMLLLQHDPGSFLEEGVTYVISLEPGLKTVVPPDWHYTLVNTGKETLATIEMYRDGQELHSCHCDQKGAGVYVIERNGLPEIVKNSQYKNLVKYATVNPESYATNFEMVPTQSLVTQVQLVSANCPECANERWKQYLDTANIGYFSF